MEIDVSRALREPGEFFPFEAAGQIAFERDDIVRVGQAHLHGRLTGIGESVAFVGEVAVPLEVSCARCLAEFPLTVTVPFEETFVRTGNIQEQAQGADDEDARPFRGETVDLAEAAEAALHLNIPLRFLCRKDCAGLCPKCGIDRNDQTCDCIVDDDDNPFAALRGLLTE